MSVESVLDQARATCEKPLLLNFAGYVVSFLTNSEKLKSYLADYYKHFLGSDADAVHCVVEGLQVPSVTIDGDWIVKHPDPGKSRVKEHILVTDEGNVINKVLTGVHLFFIRDRRVAAGPLEDNPNQVVNFINNMHLDHMLGDSGQLFHASGACIGNDGLGMAGLSGKGKSTLALRLLQNGMNLVSNDRLVVDVIEDQLTMQGIAKYPRINPGTIMNQPELTHLPSAQDRSRYEAMSLDELWNLEEKYDAFVEETFGCAFPLTARMKMFVALDWDRHSSKAVTLTRRDPAQCRGLVETVMKSPGVMLPVAGERIPQALVEPYIELLQHCEFYVLSGGVDFDDAAAQIKTELMSL